MTKPRLVGGRYELGELLGYGGMAEVHRGHDSRLNRDVAIKVLRADLARDPSFLNRFRREAHSAAGLNHPSIVAVYDTGEDAMPDGTPQPFIVMEYVEGRTLRDIVKSEGRLPVRRAMEVVADVCAALDFSHRNGIIHRDIKPANVMITPQGAVKVMDFGIARAVADNSSTVTQTANVIGTAQYLSPEQARGETVDARSDVYSTGCLLYELIAGVPPFQGDSPVAVAYQHVRENPVMPSARNPEVPRALDSIVMKALAKNQLNRYQSAGDMRQDLERALANQPVSAEAVMTDAERTQFIARTPPPPVALRRTDYSEPDDDDSRRTGLIWAAVVIALLLVIGAAGWAIVTFGKDNGPTTVAVPSIIGMTQDAAEARIRQANLKPVEGAPTSGPCAEGQAGKPHMVCTAEPGAGADVQEKTIVTYHLYSPERVDVPLVEGKTLSEALTILHDAKLQAKIHRVNSVRPRDTVVRQDPAAFVSGGVAPNSEVDIYVSTGKVQLPDVRGLTFDEAQAKLNPQFINITQGSPITTEDPNQDGLVAQESPTPGHAYDPSTEITLVLYQYVAPPPPETTPITQPVTTPVTTTTP
jgi:serine/threonine-protein kinase